MIKAEIKVITLDEKYEFNLDENTKVDLLIEEITSVISLKLGSKWNKQSRDMLLCDKTMETILPGNLTLKECDVKNGHELLLI